MKNFIYIGINGFLFYFGVTFVNINSVRMINCFCALTITIILYVYLVAIQKICLA